MNQRSVPSSVPIFRRVLFWSALAAVAVAVLGGIAGVLLAGVSGLLSALLGAGVTLLFAGVTVLSLLLAARLDTIYFMAVILGAWLCKMVLVLGILLAVRGAAFVEPWVLWGTMVAGVVATLAVDVVCVLRSRLPAVSDIALTPAPQGEQEHSD